MKRLISLFFILIGLGIFLKVTGSFSNFSFGGSGVAPVEEWEEILPGQWKVRIEAKSKFEGWLFEGKVEYFVNKEFTKFLTAKFYAFSPGASNIIDEDYLRIVAGGSASGYWTVESDGIWKELVKKCNMEVSHLSPGYNYDDVCKDKFNVGVGGEIEYGNITNEYSIYKVKVFSNSKILVEGESFSDEGKYLLTLTRIDN